MANDSLTKISENIKLIIRCYPFTIVLGAIILLASIAYTILTPPSQYCSPAGWAAAYMHLTSPFNIGCEANLTELLTQDGALKFFGDFFLVIILAFLVEHAFNSIGKNLKRNIFVAAIMGAYSLELYTLIFFKTMSVGSSIIGISMMLTLIGWLVYKGLVLRGYLLKSSLCFSSALLLSYVAFTGYSARNSSGHALGALFFIIFMGLFLKSPEWWEEFMGGIKRIIQMLHVKKG